MGKLKTVLERLKEYQPDKIILFGSYARGESDEYSDLDFVVIKKTAKRFLERLIEVAKLIDNDLGNVDVFVYTPEEFERMIEWEKPVIERVLKEGRVLWDILKLFAIDFGTHLSDFQNGLKLKNE